MKLVDPDAVVHGHDLADEVGPAVQLGGLNRDRLGLSKSLASSSQDQEGKQPCNQEARTGSHGRSLPSPPSSGIHDSLGHPCVSSAFLCVMKTPLLGSKRISHSPAFRSYLNSASRAPKGPT